MIELYDDNLVFTFPEVHPKAHLSISFQRTLRIPDDGKDYPLPPGLGEFPLKHVDDFAAYVPEPWITHGGVMLPMYQSEALWIHFDSSYISAHGTPYPFAVKIAAGKINAVTGENWSGGFTPDPQNYVVVPEQPWIDGFYVEKGIIHQFVAMPLGEGFTAEEQLTGTGAYGGLQIEVCPMARSAFERHFPKLPQPSPMDEDYCIPMLVHSEVCSSEMGLAPGGRMRQEISEDPYDVDDWETRNASRCFVHLLNSQAWLSATGNLPPHRPFTAKEYTEERLPWFEYYSDAKALEGSDALAGLKSLAVKWADKKRNTFPDNDSVSPEKVVKLRAGLKPGQVREGHF